MPVTSVMGSLNEQEDQFFDTREDITSVSDSGSDYAEITSLDDVGSADSLPGDLRYEIWVNNPGSIHERRHKFLKWLGLGVDQIVGQDLSCSNESCNETQVETDRITAASGAVLLGSSVLDDGYSSSLSSTSCWSNDAWELLDDCLDSNLLYRIKNLDDGTEYFVDEFNQGGTLGRLREAGSDCLLSVDEFERRLGLSPLIQQAMRRNVKDVGLNLGAAKKQVKMGWLQRLGSIACVYDSGMDAINPESSNQYSISKATSRTVKVRPYKKHSKEFSALYMEQDIEAHNGPILTMKFSTDGQFLASGGEDCILRVWQVTESEKSADLGNYIIDSSFIYFAVNDLSEIVPLHGDKERKNVLKGPRKGSELTCVIFPRKVFYISEKPIHEFKGHSGEVLDLSWSRNNYLLSSSTDKTVRLWKIGCDECLKVFSHNNYVTCIQFNPVDDDYFISGSIDGKVRIWEVPRCKVVDWTDITEIVTAVSYRPDGKGAVVGSITGNCRFYDASDNSLQLYARICLQHKKSSFKRITGFQYSPVDSNKLMVTSADSRVRILHGIDVVRKFRGFCNAGSQISASFTSDGKHVVSASEDSNVYVWNHVSQGGSGAQTKNKWSCECFFSNDASVAIPWCGPISRHTSEISSMLKFVSSSLASNGNNGMQQSEMGDSSQHKLPVSSSEHFSLANGFFSEALVKGTATWPEENLPASTSPVVNTGMCKSQFKFLKTSCQRMLDSSHAWGLVIVTAGWDGRIRSFHNYGLPIKL